MAALRILDQGHIRAEEMTGFGRCGSGASGAIWRRGWWAVGALGGLITTPPRYRY
jgi:hypothetical protein